MKTFVCSIITVLVIVCTPREGAARPAKVDRSIPCPGAIGDSRDGSLFSGRSSNSPFLCFRKASDGSKSGFVSTAKTSVTDFSGWYRLSLSVGKDTCEHESQGSAGPVLFLQLKQSTDVIYADLCPSNGTLTGTRAAATINIANEKSLNELPQVSFCENGEVKRSQHLQMSRAVVGAGAFTVNYTVIDSCPGGSSAGRTCVREYRGTAFHETHKIWPAVADSFTGLLDGCRAALHTCVDCHPELAGLPAINP